MSHHSWNDKAHVSLSRLLNEDQKRGAYSGIEAIDALTLEFIDTHRLQLSHTPRFLRSEERISASVFLSSVRRRAKRRTARLPVGTSRQLTEFVTVYFPNFIPILRIEFLKMLRHASSAEQIIQHGLTRLAAAYLEGARDDAEREIRRLGGTLDVTIIDHLETRVEPATTLCYTSFDD